MLVRFIISSISIFLLYSAYAYLRDSKSCKCIQDKRYPARLKNLELVILSFNIITLTLAFIGSEFNVLHILAKSGISIYTIGTIVVLIMLSFYSYFVYNVYKFRQTTACDCKCADKWPRMFIYLQAIVITLMLIVTVWGSVSILSAKSSIGSTIKKLSPKPLSFKRSSFIK